MSTAIQRRRGTTAQHSSFTGLNGELTVDTDKEVVVVHDGATAGGYPQMRENGSNSALALGSAGTPSLKFTGDTNTGIYSPGADQVAISTNGTGRLFVDANGRTGINTTPDGTSSLAVKALTDATNGGLNIISVDGNGAVISRLNDGGLTFRNGGSERMRLDSSGRLGLGTSSPSQPIHLRVDQAAYTWSRIDNQSSSSSAYSGLMLAANGNTWGLVNGSTAANSNSLAFVLDAGGGNSEKMRLDSSGRVGIGTTNPGAQNTATPLVVGNTSANNGITILTGTLNDGVLNFNDGDNTSLRGYLIYEHSTDSLRFGANGSERGRFDSSGRLLVGTSSTSKQTRVLVQGNSGGGQTAEIIFAADSSSPGGGLGNIYFSDNSHNTAATIAAVRDGGTWTSGSSHPVSLQFYTTANGASSPTERMRITQAGFLKASNNATYNDNAGTYHEFVSSVNAVNILQRQNNTSFTNVMFKQGIYRAASNLFDFIAADSGDGSTNPFNDREFTLRGDGQAYADGSWNGGGADYAEYFEWSDGNPDEEDRRGISVVLDGSQIRPAADGEDPIGVISGNPSVVGDAAWNKWSGKYLRDDYGTYIQEDYEVVNDEGETVIQQRRKLNPAYDPDQQYVNREDRPEWDCVGLMGKLRIRKGQVTGARWIKMRDVSDSVEEWLVR